MSKSPTFSALQRPKAIKQLTSQTYDLLVIGGGITGAGIALDAASRGMSVALIEKNDFASGTSSRSTKLIHGGLRYLKQLEFGLVREVGRERAILHKNASHLVIPENMFLPIIEQGSLGRYSSSVGLYVYDWLAGVKRAERRAMLNKQEAHKQEPLLRKDILLGGGLYKEYRTDDARLVIEVMKTAVAHGANCVNYVKGVGFTYNDSGVVSGIEAEDRMGESNFTIKARKTVNAAGPWVDKVRKLDHEVKGKRLHLTKGVHLVVPYQRLPLNQAIYFDVSDKRMIFAIPRGKTTYVGTTDTDYKGVLEKPRTRESDLKYVLDAANFIFPTVNLTLKDVISSWAGLRPLIHEEGKGPSELSRKDEIFVSESGIVSIAGGKLTGFRKMAERTVDLVAKQLYKESGTKFKQCFTDQIIISGGELQEVDDFREYISDLTGTAGQVGYNFEGMQNLFYKYGSNTPEVIELAFDLYSEEADVQKRKWLAELVYGIRHEAVCNLSDYFIRRTGRLYFERGVIADQYPVLEKKIAAELTWSEEDMTEYKQAFFEEYEQVVTFN